MLDNKLIMIVFLAAFAGVFTLWLLDSDHNKIEQNILRGLVGTVALINILVLWPQPLNRGVVRTAWQS